MKLLLLAITLIVSSLLVVSGDEQVCRLNEVWNNCGSTCQLHCPVRNSRTGELEDGSKVACDRMCHRLCQCAPGLVRDLKRGGQCVEKVACTPPDAEVAYIVTDEPKCGPNEIFTTCGTACPAHCPVKDPKTGEIIPDNMICPAVCKIGCECMNGFVRDAKRNNACVEKSLCSAP